SQNARCRESSAAPPPRPIQRSIAVEASSSLYNRGTGGFVEMRFVLLSLCWIASAQAPTRDLRLVGDRFKPLTYDQLTPAQKTMADHLLEGERGTMSGPFNVLLRSPEMGDAVQKLGAQVRFHASLPPRLNEFAILITGRFWNAQYEWYAHKRLAL